MSAVGRRPETWVWQSAQDARRLDATFACSAAVVALLFAFLSVQVVLIASHLRGAFLDEGIYITDGIRTLQGHSLQDGYATWVAGSQLWPVLAALAFKLGGLHGARIAAAATMTIALGISAQASRNLFGAAAGAWALAFAVTSGPVLALAHLAVYDVIAVLGAACAIWAVTQLDRRDNRVWLVVASVSLTIGVLAKYPAIIFTLPPLIALIVALRGAKARMDLCIFAFLTACLLLVYFLQDRGQLATFIAFRLTNNPTFGVTHAMIAFAQVYFVGVPFIIGLAGVVEARGQRRLASVMLAALLLPAAYHLSAGNAVGDEKHVVLGLLFALPLIGLVLARAARTAIGAIMVTGCLLALAAFGSFQMTRIDHGFPDPSNVSQILVHRVRAGQRLLINNSWPYILALYNARKLRSPYDVYDVYRVEHHQAPGSLCTYAWFVNSPGGASWPRSVVAAIERCGTYRRVYRSSATLTGLGDDLRFVTYTAPVEVWSNRATGSGVPRTSSRRHTRLSHD